ncbi:hypothetical protein [Thalassotalea fusca]
MWVFIIAVIALSYIATVTWLSYHLGCTKTENPKASAIIGFVLSFLPPLCLIYLICLSLKDEVATV